LQINDKDTLQQHFLVLHFHHTMKILLVFTLSVIDRKMSEDCVIHWVQVASDLINAWCQLHLKIVMCPDQP